MENRMVDREDPLDPQKAWDDLSSEARAISSAASSLQRLNNVAMTLLQYSANVKEDEVFGQGVTELVDKRLLFITQENGTTKFRLEEAFSEYMDRKLTDSNPINKLPKDNS